MSYDPHGVHFASFLAILVSVIVGVELFERGLHGGLAQKKQAVAVAQTENRVNSVAHTRREHERRTECGSSQPTL